MPFQKATDFGNVQQPPDPCCFWNTTGWCIQSTPTHLYREWPLMSANLIPNETRIDCKISHKRNEIWVQTFLGVNKYKCKHWNVPLNEIRPDIKVKILSMIFRVCTNIKSPLKTFALIFGPFPIKSSSHILSLLWLSLHLYQVFFGVKFALISGPPR